MFCGEDASSRPNAVEKPAVVQVVKVECGRDHRCLFRHLTLAAEELARRDGAAGAAARYAAAVARFRDLAYGPPREGVGPVVPLEGGRVVPLSNLLADAWLREHGAFPDQGINPELLEAARQLLLDLAWQLPDP